MDGRSRRTQLITVAVFVVAGLAMYARHRQAEGVPRASVEPAAPTPQAHPDANATAARGYMPSATEPAPAPNPYARTDDAIQRASKGIAQLPETPGGYVALASAYVRKFRETGDAGYLSRAETSCDKARQLSPDDYSALSLLPCIYGIQHRFGEAIALARKATAVKPDDPFNYGTLGDALAETGDYDQAINAINQMVRLRPDSRSYARIAQLHELHGDVDGAIEIMRLSVGAAAGAEAEHRAWCHVRMGNLFFSQGRLGEAEPEYAAALEAFPGYSFGLTCLARLRAAQGKFDEAVALYGQCLELAPRQETIVLFGDLLLHLNRQKEAADVFELMEAIEKIMRANRVVPGHVLVLFWADHDLKLDEALEQAERCASERKDIRTMDALAWGRYKKGLYREALTASDDSLRLNTPDALLHFHRGMIQLKLGARSEAAAALKRALEINPHFDIRHAQEARTALSAIDGKP